jgi:hypothetical protein
LFVHHAYRNQIKKHWQQEERRSCPHTAEKNLSVSPYHYLETFIILLNRPRENLRHQRQFGALQDTEEAWEEEKQES